MIYIACVHFRLAKAPSSIAVIQLYQDDHVVTQVLIQQPAGKYSLINTWTLTFLVSYCVCVCGVFMCMSMTNFVLLCCIMCNAIAQSRGKSAQFNIVRQLTCDVNGYRVCVWVCQFD